MPVGKDGDSDVEFDDDISDIASFRQIDEVAAITAFEVNDDGWADEGFGSSAVEVGNSWVTLEPATVEAHIKVEEDESLVSHIKVEENQAPVNHMQMMKVESFVEFEAKVSAKSEYVENAGEDEEVELVADDDQDEKIHEANFVTKDDFGDKADGSIMQVLEYSKMTKTNRMTITKSNK